MNNSIHIVHPEGFQRVFNREYKSPSPLATVQELFDEWNSGNQRESKEFLRSGARSLSVGDFVGVDGSYYQCKPNGWEIVKLAYVNNILNMVQENIRADNGNRMTLEHAGRIGWKASREYRDGLR